MKKLLLFSFIIGFVFSGMHLSAQFSEKGKFQTLYEKKMEVVEQQMKTKGPDNQVNLKAVQGNPGSSENYTWVDEDWLHVMNSSFSYDEMGHMTGELVTDAVTGDGVYKVDYGFDAQQNQVQFVYSEWIEGAWMIIFGFKNENVYDDSGNVMESIMQFYNSETMEWENSGKFTGVYSDEGTILEEVYSYWDGSAWQLDYRYQYSIDDQGVWTGLTGSWWGGSDWQNDWRYIDWVFQDWENWVESSATYQEWNSAAWEDIQRFSTEFSDDGYIRIYQSYNGGTWESVYRTTYTETLPEHVYLDEYYDTGIEEWVNSQRWTDFLDDHQNFSGIKLEYWEQGEKSMAGSWIIEIYIYELHTYNDNDDLAEVIVQIWDLDLQMLVNLDRRVFSYALTGTRDLQSGTDLRAFPNPVENVLEINATGLTEHSTYVIADLNGRIIRKGELQKGSQSLDVSNLNPGMYFLNVYTPDNRKTSLKIIKK